MRCVIGVFSNAASSSGRRSISRVAPTGWLSGRRLATEEVFIDAGEDRERDGSGLIREVRDFQQQLVARRIGERTALTNWTFGNVAHRVPSVRGRRVAVKRVADSSSGACGRSRSIPAVGPADPTRCATAESIAAEADSQRQSVIAISISFKRAMLSPASEGSGPAMTKRAANEPMPPSSCLIASVPASRRQAVASHGGHGERIVQYDHHGDQAENRAQVDSGPAAAKRQEQ
ncbi:MAG: hypothetical protein R3C45_19685 [Phycisphaerales bacterium]